MKTSEISLLSKIEKNLNAEVFLYLRGDFKKGTDTNSLICSIFTLEIETDDHTDSYSLVYGDAGHGIQADPFFKYFNYQANIAVGDSSGGQWDSAWGYSSKDEGFTKEIDAPSWSSKDEEMLERLHLVAREYLIWIAGEDGEKYCVVKPDSLKILQVHDNNPEYGKKIFSTEGYDDEKFYNFSNIWSLGVTWE